eukprot:Skav215461  [mRNA]  locus=scaffold1089:4004:4351:- [translate_table: standard]
MAMRTYRVSFRFEGETHEIEVKGKHTLKDLRLVLLATHPNVFVNKASLSKMLFSRNGELMSGSRGRRTMHTKGKSTWEIKDGDVIEVTRKDPAAKAKGKSKAMPKRSPSSASGTQ